MASGIKKIITSAKIKKQLQLLLRLRFDLTQLLMGNSATAAGATDPSKKSSKIRPRFAEVFLIMGKKEKFVAIVII